MGIVFKTREINLDRCAASIHLCSNPARKPKATHRVHPRDMWRTNPPSTSTYVVFDIDDTPDGKLFLVMEYDPGVARRQDYEI